MRYAARLFASLVAVTAVGGVLVGLGLALGWPGVLGSGRIASALGSASGGAAYTAAGGVVLLVGICVLSIGYLAAGYKLVADAVAAGTGAEATAAGEPETAADSRSVPGLDESPAATEPPVEGDGSTAGTPAGRDDPASTSPTAAPDATPDDVGGEHPPASVTADEPGEAEASAEAAEPPEMTPEEIAFGSSTPADESPESGDDGSVEEDPVDDEGRFQDEGVEAEEVDDEFEDEPIEAADDVTNVRPAGSSASSDPLGDPTEDD